MRVTLRLLLKYLLLSLTYGVLNNDIISAGIYLLKVNNKNTTTRWEICSKVKIKTPKRRNWCRTGVFIVYFGHISHLALVFLWLTCNCLLG